MRLTETLFSRKLRARECCLPPRSRGLIFSSVQGLNFIISLNRFFFGKKLHFEYGTNFTWSILEYFVSYIVVSENIKYPNRKMTFNLKNKMFKLL